MLSIAIYSDISNDVETLKVIVQDFLIETKMLAKVSYFNDPETFITVPGGYDIYIMDMDSKDDVIELGHKMNKIDTGSHFIYLSTDTSNAHLAAKARVDYYLNKPLDHDEILCVLKEVKKKIQDDNIIIKIASGERRLRVNHLNYINIEKRCLCYHLTDGNMFDGQTLRTSFEKAIDPLQKHKAFLFIPPSLLINIGEIKIVNSDNIVFENDDVLYFPKKAYDTVRNAWLGYCRILN